MTNNEPIDPTDPVKKDEADRAVSTASELIEIYYRAESVWHLPNGEEMTLRFGYFDTHEAADDFNQRASIRWTEEGFALLGAADYAVLWLKDDQLQLASGHALSTLGAPSADTRGFLRRTHRVVRRCERALTLAQAYDEVWRVVFSLLKSLGDVLKRRDGFKASGVDAAYALWQRATGVMQGRGFAPGRHNERLTEVYEILSDYFFDLDPDADFAAIKYGSTRLADIFDRVFAGEPSLLNRDVLEPGWGQR